MICIFQKFFFGFPLISVLHLVACLRSFAGGAYLCVSYVYSGWDGTFTINVCHVIKFEHNTETHYRNTCNHRVMAGIWK